MCVCVSWASRHCSSSLPQNMFLHNRPPTSPLDVVSSFLFFIFPSVLLPPPPPSKPTHSSVCCCHHPPSSAPPFSLSLSLFQASKRGSGGSRGTRNTINHGEVTEHGGTTQGTGADKPVRGEEEAEEEDDEEE